MRKICLRGDDIYPFARNRAKSSMLSYKHVELIAGINFLWRLALASARWALRKPG